MRTVQQIFEEELSGEPLTQGSVIEGMIIAQIEIVEDMKQDYVRDCDIEYMDALIYSLKLQLEVVKYL